MTESSVQEVQEIMKSQEKKKKPYSAPTLKELNPEQAKKLVAERKLCSEKEAAIAFLNGLSRQQPSEAKDQKRKRSA